MLWEILWIGWLAIFGVLEGYALANSEKGDTLSENVWKYLTRPGNRYHHASPFIWAGRVGVVGLCGWLAFHFLTGI